MPASIGKVLLFSAAIQLLGHVAAGCGSASHYCRGGERIVAGAMPSTVCPLLINIEAVDLPPTDLAGAAITYPYDETVFPPEFAAPTFEWKATPESPQWLIQLSFKNHADIYAVTKTPQWTPDEETWAEIKAATVNTPAAFTVYGFKNSEEMPVRSQNSIRFSTSIDRVDAPILYRQVPLPFKVNTENFKKMKLRLGDIASNDPPPVIMEDLPICAGCHTATQDGSVISMEMNYNDDNGAQLMVPIEKRIRLSRNSFMTWSRFPKPDILPPTRGLFAKISPSGKYLMGTVNEISYSAQTQDKTFSQLFFPTYGILAWYSTANKTMKPLPGADNTDYVQTDPTWRWDEREIAFARAETRNEYHEDVTNPRNRVEKVGIHALNEKFPIQFSLYKLPFNQGQGGTAVPIEGAPHNGMSNYFPRYSPDGKWIVFTKSKSGIMLQPDSELYIVPSAGGTARRMRCNRSRFNSWHSFSPNGKWLLFTSKANSPYTEIFLTHIDAAGNDAPPVRLSRFSNDQMAANVPEFVNIAPDAIKSIRIR